MPSFWSVARVSHHQSKGTYNFRILIKTFINHNNNPLLSTVAPWAFFLGGRSSEISSYLSQTNTVSYFLNMLHFSVMLVLLSFLMKSCLNSWMSILPSPSLSRLASSFSCCFSGILLWARYGRQIRLLTVGYKFRGSIFKSEEKNTLAVFIG